MRLLNIRGGGGGSHSNFSHLLWVLILCQLFAHGMGFFPMFSNFFTGFKNQNGGGASSNGGVSIYSAAASTNRAATSNESTSIRVPMLNHVAQRRVDVVTTVISPVSHSPVPDEGNVTQSPNNATFEVHQNFTTTFPDQTVQQTSQKFVIPTSTSVTSSISAVQQGLPLSVLPNALGLTIKNPTTLMLPFTPNLFGMMSYVQALKDIKRNYKDQEKERKLVFHNKDSGDLMTRILRALIHKVVNKHQKHTEMLRLQVLKRQEKLQKFLQMPMVSQVVAMDQARAAAALAAAGGDGVAAPQPIQQQFGLGLLSRSGKHMKTF